VSVSFDGVKVGDRVRLSAENTEPVEVVVSQVGRAWIAAENGQAFWAEYWDTVEVLSPPKPPLPTEFGLYVRRPDRHYLASSDVYRLSARGIWSRVDVWGWWTLQESNVPADLVRLVPEGEPSGLLEAIEAVRALVMNTDGDYLAGEDFDGLAGCIQQALAEHGLLPDAIEKAEAQS
jgi:hypothetical protein